MPFFSSDGIRLFYEVFGEGPPVLLIHGFASNITVNWVATGWVDTVTGAGYRAIAIDNRGHGQSQKLYDPRLYFAHDMAEDAVHLLDWLAIEKAAVIGYSMGARIAAFMALAHPQRVAAAVLGGMGANLVTGLDDSEEIISALTAESLAEITHPTGRQFRIFAEHSGADRTALAACMISSREPMRREDVGRIAVPALVAVGGTDTMAGAPETLAAMLPRGEAFRIGNRDHMRATGDRLFKEAAIDFLARCWPTGQHA